MRDKEGRGHAESQSRVTIYDVARLAGVSHTSVSRAFSKDPRFASRLSIETRRRIEKIAENVGFVPNASARTLRTSRTHRICVVTNNYFASSVNSMADEIQESGRERAYFTFLSLARTPAEASATLYQLRQRIADGVVFYETQHITKKDVERIARLGVAVVGYGLPFQTGLIDAVRPTETRGREEAFAAAAARGYRKAALIGDRTNPNHARRLEEYVGGLPRYGIHIPASRIYDGVRTDKDAYQTAVALLRGPYKPDVVFSMNDRFAARLEAGVLSRGAKIPDDLAIIGIGNTIESTTAYPALSSIGPVVLTFRPVTELLYSRLAARGTLSGRERTVQWHFIPRDSI